MTDKTPHNPLWNHDPEAALAEAERRIRDTGRLGLRSWWHMQALDRLPANIRDMTDEVLDLGGTNVSDLTPLVGTRVKYLSLSKKVSDIAPLAQLKDLKRLNIGWASITNIEPLTACSELAELNLTTHSDFDPAPLGALPNLRHLTVAPRDRAHFPAMPGLEHFYVNGNIDNKAQVDLGFLADSPRLGFLAANSVRCFNLPKTCPKLYAAFLAVSSRADLETVLAYPSLKHLTLCNSRINSLSGIPISAPISSIDLSDTQIADISCLTALPYLYRITIRGTPIEDIVSLSYMEGLEDLDASHSKVSSLKGWNPDTRISRLRLSHTEVSDLRPLFGSNVYELHVSHTPVSNIDGFSRMRSLSRLDISSTQVSEIAPSQRAATVLNLDEKKENADPRDGRWFRYADTPLADSGFVPKDWQSALSKEV